MIHHIVLIRARAGVSDAEIAAVFDGLAALTGRIAGFRSLTGGRSQSPEQIERGYLHGFVATYDDWDALARYAADAEHKALGGRLVALAEGGIDGILVVDLEG